VDDIELTQVSPGAATLRPVEEKATTLAALAHLTTAVNEAQQAQADLVADARANGHSWSEIGRALGISRQLAHQRFSRRTG